MKRFGLVLAAATLALAALGAASSASAADKPGPFDSKQIDQGKKDAPAVVQAAGLNTCQVADAGYSGEGQIKDPADPKKEVKVKIYEVACQDGEGYVIQAIEGGKSNVYDCVTLEGAGQNCRLPENADTKKMLQPMVTAAGKTCTVTQDRALGATPAGDRFFEVACQQGGGYIVKAGPPGGSSVPVAESCAQHVGTSLECKFTTKAQIDAALNARMTELVSQSGKTCQVSGSREIGEDVKTGESYYEVACGHSVGYVLIANKGGSFVRSIDCANFTANGGCKLTDAVAAQTQEVGVYTHLANQGGFPCQVAEYRFIGIDKASNSEVVELKCSNRPDGRIAFFPTSNTGPAKFYDCVEAGIVGQTCKLTDATPLFAKYTMQLAAKGKHDCKVSNATGIGQTATGDRYIETACTDGLPGWVIQESASGQAGRLMSCGEARAAGLACRLPGDTK